MTQIIAAAVLGVAVRLAVAWAAPDMPPVADMEHYHERAVYLREHGTFGPDALRGPGYPIVLAVAYTVMGESNWAGRVANAIIGGLLVLATGLLARAVGGGERAWLAAAIVAAYPGYLVSALYQMSDIFYTLLAVACVLAAAARGPAAAALAGAATGVALLTRSAGLVLISAVGLAWALDGWRGHVSRRDSLARVLLFGVACAVVVAPWLTYTARIAGGPILDATSGFNAVIGNNPRANGRHELAKGQWLIDTYLKNAVSIADQQRQGVEAAARWARENPGPWLRLGVAKLAYLWGLEGREHVALYSYNYFHERSRATITGWAVAVLLSFPVLVAVATIGVITAAGGWTSSRAAVGALILAASLLHVLSFGESRFHLPFVPLLAAAATLGWRAPLRLPPTRTAAMTIVFGMLLWAWAGQLPALWHRVDAIRQPGGSQTFLEY